MTSVLATVEAGVALVTLNAPERRNALNLEMCERITEEMRRLDADEDVRAVVVTGTAPAFCAGADLSHLGSSSRDGLLAIYEGFLQIARCRLPTIAAVNGPAVGAGMNLALACDVRLAARSATFDARFLQLGLHPGGGHTWMMRNAAGEQATYASVLFGETFDGEHAARCGLAWRCFADEALLDGALQLAAKAAAAPRELVIRTKQTIRSVTQIDQHDRATELELQAQVWSVEQPAFQHRLQKMMTRIKSR